tara:strand:+ start:3613 stop:4443 length:831 start_codon:yes stop_codon:yes gene_type:complete
MKTNLLLLALTIALPLTLPALPRTFTVNDGRTLEATLLNVHPTRQQVEIKRTDGKTMTVDQNLFSTADQAYIQKWYAAHQLLANRLHLTLKDVEGDYTKTKHEVNFAEERTGRRGSGFGVVEIATDKKTPIHYELQLTNRGDLPIEKLKVEYKLFYLQERAVELEDENQPNRSENSDRPTPHRPEEQLKIKKGRLKTLTLQPNESTTHTTSTVTLLERSATRRYQQYINLESELLGIWVRCSLRDPDGGEVIRDIVEPDRLRKTVTWDQEEIEEES